jgi:hypothetical protein
MILLNRGVIGLTGYMRRSLVYGEINSSNNGFPLAYIQRSEALGAL